MKKALALILALVLCFSLVACGAAEESSNSKIKKYVAENKSELLDSMEESFATSSGMTCTSDIEVIGNGFVIDININELDDVDQSIKDQLQSAYDSMDDSFDSLLTELQKEVPEIEYFTINVNEKDGDRLATITAGKK